MYSLALKPCLDRAEIGTSREGKTTKICYLVVRKVFDLEGEFEPPPERQDGQTEVMQEAMVDHEGIRPIKKICGDVIKFIDEFPRRVEQLEPLMQLMAGPSRQGIAATECVTGIFSILKGIVAVQAQMLLGRGTPTELVARNSGSPDVLCTRCTLGILDKDDKVIGVTLEIGGLEEQAVHDP
jgi:hypothetical protein